MPRPVLVVSNSGDEHAIRVASILEARRVPVRWFDPGDYPDHAGLTVEMNGGASASRVGRLDVSGVRAALYRRPRLVPSSEQIRRQRARALAASEGNLFVKDFLGTLACAWVPADFETLRRADRKLTQLVHATTVGFRIPPTLVTSEPEAFWEFHRQHDGRIVTKLANRAFFDHFDKFMRYTNRVSASDLAQTHALRLSPVIVQAEIEKAIELRVTVVGERVFAIAIHSQSTRRTTGDWRRYAFGRFGTPHRPHELPEPVRAACVKLIQAFGLTYGAIDLILTPTGEYVFLELNPNGQWLWLELLTRVPISEAIADLLLELSSDAVRRDVAPSSKERCGDSPRLEVLQ